MRHLAVPPTTPEGTALCYPAVSGGERPSSSAVFTVHHDKSRWTTFVDIEGNEFDLIAG
jgi:hypothetical protein